MSRLRPTSNTALRRTLLTTLCSALLFGSCGLIDKVTSNKFLVVTWFKMPAFEQEPFKSLPGLGAVVVNAIYIDASKTPPKPVEGGFAAFFGAGKKVDLVEQPVPGVYAQTSVEDPALIYDSSETKRFGLKACLIYREGCVGAEQTVRLIKGAPELDLNSLRITPAPTESPLPGFSGRIVKGEPLTINFPAPLPGAVYRPVLIVFGPTGNADKPFEQIYSTMPSAPEKYLDFLNSEPKFELTIPGEVFNAEGPYAVLAATARITLETRGLFFGSGAIAGAANGFLFEIPIEGLPLELPALP